MQHHRDRGPVGPQGILLGLAFLGLFGQGQAAAAQPKNQLEQHKRDTRHARETLTVNDKNRLREEARQQSKPISNNSFKRSHR